MTDTADRAGDSVLGCLLAFYTPQLVTVIQATGLVWDDFTLDRQQVVYRAVLGCTLRGGSLICWWLRRSSRVTGHWSAPGVVAVCSCWWMRRFRAWSGSTRGCV
jgi:hypothetical protein